LRCAEIVRGLDIFHRDTMTTRDDCEILSSLNGVDTITIGPRG